MGRVGNKEGSTRKIKDGKWECVIQSKYINPDSKTGSPKRIKRTGDSEEQARKKAKRDLRAWEKAYERNKENLRTSRLKTFGEYMQEFIDSEIKGTVTGATYKSYVYTMEANFYNKKISKLQLRMLNIVEFEVYFDQLIHEKSQKTAALPIQMCRRCTKWLLGRSLIDEDYAAFAKTKKQKKDEFFRKEVDEDKSRKKIFTYEDIVKFYDAYKNNVSEYCPAIILILETLMRGQEVLALGLNDIDFENNIIIVRSAVSERFIDNDRSKGLEKYVKVPKNGEERIVYMSPLAREVVCFMIDQVKLKSRANPNNLLFPSYLKHGKMRSMDSFELQFKDLCNKLGIDRDVRMTKCGIKKGLNVHALRHTAITIANTAPGANVINTALMAGHKAISTENIYTHTNVDALKAVKTASGIVLHLGENSKNGYFENAEINDEMRAIYIKLKEVFGGS